MLPSPTRNRRLMQSCVCRSVRTSCSSSVLLTGGVGDAGATVLAVATLGLFGRNSISPKTPHTATSTPIVGRLAEGSATFATVWAALRAAASEAIRGGGRRSPALL